MSTQKSFLIKLNGEDRIKVDICDRAGLVHGQIESTLKVVGRTMDEEDVAFNAAVDGMESLILAQACAGMDLNHPDYVEAVNTAYEAINNHF